MGSALHLRGIAPPCHPPWGAAIGVIAAAQDEVTLARALGSCRPDVLIVDYDPARGDTLALCRGSRPADTRRAC